MPEGCWSGRECCSVVGAVGATEDAGGMLEWLKVLG